MKKQMQGVLNGRTFFGELVLMGLLGLMCISGSSAAEYVVVDDFESYDLSVNYIYDTWEDAWINGTGSEVFLEIDPQYVRDGKSMNFLYYNNTRLQGRFVGSVVDADTANLGVGADWTSYEAIVLWFYGQTGNSATPNDIMWVQLDDTSSNAGVVLYDGDANDVAVEGWHQWSIDLSLFDASGVSLTNVDKIHIGFGGYNQTGQMAVGGRGTVYFDDIRLYSDTPQEPQCWEEQTKLLASDGAVQDRFGLSVAVSGDYAVVGAPSDEDNGYASGSGYIFVRDGNNWGQQAKLLPSDGQEDDNFGDSVSISGDYCIIGAHVDDDNGQYSGSAYIFVQDGNSWVQQAKLLASDGAAYDYFGRPVSICDDYAIVGAKGDDDNGYSSGSAYIFVRDGNSWVQQAKLTASDGQEYDYFGSSVSISGDYCVVGAYEDDDNGNASGSAYMFKREAELWSEQAKLTASDGAAGDWFGISVSVSGDYAIVGDSNDTDNGYASGSAYIFVRDGNSWLQQAKLLPSDGEEWDLFGVSVSISGDYGVVGALFDDDNGLDSGSAYVFENICEPNNAPPIADAGPDQTLYVTDYNTPAEVTLDGSGSYDPDDDELTYTWFMNDSNDPNGPVIATAVSPTISLPIGQHTIELIVNDGEYDSEPDQVVITVVKLNAPPVADAGPDQTLYVPDYNTLAEVTLDGSGSYDPDEDELTYAWFLGGSEIATGISPTIFLPAGQHTIELIANDGRDDSEPDQVVITVVCTPDMEATIKLTPQMLNCKSKGKWVKAHVTLPEEIYPEDIDVNTPAVAEPPGVESEYIEVFDNGRGRFDVQIYFNRQSFCEELSETENGLLEVTVTGSLLDGRKFQGSDTIKLKSKPWHHQHRKNKH
ncbi:MAG: FG-GAP repeat protein [Planctomycetota bacterium]|jgi:hypothetical protein